MVRHIVQERLQLVRLMEKGRHLENALDQARLGQSNCESVGETKTQRLFLALEAQLLFELGHLHQGETVLRKALGLKPKIDATCSVISTALVVQSSIDEYDVSNIEVVGRRWHRARR
jgi:hypothetical protein